MEQESRWITIATLESEYGFSKSTQAKYRMANKIPFIKIGKYIRYDRQDIDDWIESYKVDGNTRVKDKEKIISNPKNRGGRDGKKVRDEKQRINNLSSEEFLEEFGDIE